MDNEYPIVDNSPCEYFIEKDRSKRTNEIIHINCHGRKTAPGVMLKLIQRFRPSFPDRGFSIDEILECLRKDVQFWNYHLIVILEDVDVLIDHGGLDFLITLLNDDNFTLVLLSRIPYEDLIDICNTVPDFPVEKIKYIEFGKHIIITQDDLKGR